MCDPVSEPNEAAVCAAMVEGAREALAGYCSSIEEDLGLLRGGSLVVGSRQELAVQVRVWACGCGCDYCCVRVGERGVWVGWLGWFLSIAAGNTTQPIATVFFAVTMTAAVRAG